MSTAVPALERAIAIISFMANRPDVRFRSSEIADALGISKGTCYSLLMCLVDAGWLERDDEGKTYALGPTLASIGSAAQLRHAGLGEASAAIRALSRQLGVPCLVAAAVKDDIVVVDRAVPPGMLQGLTPSVPHTKLAPPAGMVYMSWVGESRFMAWLRGHGVTERADQQRYLAAARVVRARGYAGGLENSQTQLLKLLKRLSVATDAQWRQEVAAEIFGILQHGVNFVSSPVFAADGSVPLALTIINPPDAIVGNKFDQMTGHLTKAAARVTASIGGRQPTVFDS